MSASRQFKEFPVKRYLTSLVSARANRAVQLVNRKLAFVRGCPFYLDTEEILLNEANELGQLVLAAASEFLLSSAGAISEEIGRNTSAAAVFLIVKDDWYEMDGLHDGFVSMSWTVMLHVLFRIFRRFASNFHSRD